MNDKSSLIKLGIDWIRSNTKQGIIVDSSRLEDQDWVSELWEVEESQHVEIVVECSCKVFPDDALPFAFSTSEFGFVASQVFDHSETNVFFEHDVWLFLFFSDEFGGFCVRKKLLLTIFFVSSSLISLCRILNGGKSASGSFTYYYSSSYSIVSYIFYLIIWTLSLQFKPI